MTLRIIGSKTLLGVGVAGVLGVAALAGAGANTNGEYWAGDYWVSAPVADQHVATRRGPGLLEQVDARPANWIWKTTPGCLYRDRTNPSLGRTGDIC